MPLGASYPIGVDNKRMPLETNFALFSASFILGLAHTLEPCEDKAVVSLYALWSSKRWKEGIVLVVLFGLGMTLIDTLLGFLFSSAGIMLSEFKRLFEMLSGILTTLFGFLMLSGLKIVHSIHHHADLEERNNLPSHLGKSAVLLFGLVRGLPPCPFEMAVWLWAASMGSVFTGTLMVFTFGLGTTIGLIPLGIVMGGIAGAAKRSKYNSWIPKISGAATILIGLILVLGIEI